MSEFNFDIDQIANNTITKTDKTTEIITDSNTSNTGQIVFFEKLSPDQQTAITAKTPALVDTFLSDQNALLDFGQSAVEAVNVTVNHILAEQKNYRFLKWMTCLKTLTVSSMVLSQNTKTLAQLT